MTRKNLDGDVPSKTSVPRAIDLARSTSTNRCKDLLRTESGAATQGHSL
jgi:hypothetical protein